MPSSYLPICVPIRYPVIIIMPKVKELLEVKAFIVCAVQKMIMCPFTDESHCEEKE